MTPEFNPIDTVSAPVSAGAGIGYSFSHLSLIMEALNLANKDSLFHCFVDNLPKNDRMAVYGSHVAETYLCREWMKRNLTKGQWNQTRQDFLGLKNLARIGLEIDLNSCANMKLVGKPALLSESQVLMARTIEAILGAVHLDGGDAALEKAMEELGLITRDFLDLPKAGILEIHRHHLREQQPLVVSFTAQPDKKFQGYFKRYVKLQIEE
ncbi:hypothetical protein PISL3812_01013 [Talaromyces islandicus]|uniref:RNase III domain-containing protein n=1 Tax=Talaromyces islandicus TaxID=28573 RepID=A0A0U1LKY1_TALIS|nr:hypothetical protein PISL3812_01013 [Talaromyces islandicus]